MDVELVTLGFLMSGPKTGYKLKQICDNMEMFYGVTLNKIYPVLRKLEGQGFIRKEVVYEENRPRKNLYEITEAGRGYLIERLKAPPEPIDFKTPFIMRAFFFRFLKRAETIRQFELEIASLRSQVEDLQRVRKRVRETSDPDGLFVYETTLKVFRLLLSCHEKELAKRKGDE